MKTLNLTPQQVHELKSIREELASKPEETWCVGTVTNEIGQHCALGHLGMKKSITLNDTSVLERVIFLHETLQSVFGAGLANINDATGIAYDDAYHLAILRSPK